MLRKVYEGEISSLEISPQIVQMTKWSREYFKSIPFLHHLLLPYTLPSPYLRLLPFQVHLPDGRVQTVTYTADHYNGYVADVKYEGTAVYPEAKPYHPAPAPKYHPAPVHA